MLALRSLALRPAVLARFPRSRALAGSSTVTQRQLSTSSSGGDESEAGGAKLVKRKVAMVAGYSGTGYSGVQLNAHVHTIEHELRDAVFRVGAMRESNFEDLGKIDWSRSSRTDKGVHAGCIVVRGWLATRLGLS